MKESLSLEHCVELLNNPLEDFFFFMVTLPSLSWSKDSIPAEAFHGEPEYSGALVKPMKNEYCIEPAGTAFIVIDDAGERVDTYPTKEAAQQDIERCQKEDAMWETAKQLVDTAIKAHMQMFGVDREAAQ